MRRLCSALMALALAAPLLLNPFGSEVYAGVSGSHAQDEGQQPRTMGVPERGRRRRRDRGRGRHGIRSAFKKAGKSAGRGGKGFGKNMARGRPVRAGKEFGKGMGGFGKHTGKGVGRTMRRVFKP
jgi:hypothetical protein